MSPRDWARQPTVVFSKTAGRHNLAQVVVFVNLAACYVRFSVLPSSVATWLKINPRFTQEIAKHCWEYYFSSYCGGNSFSCKVSNRSPKERQFLTCNEKKLRVRWCNWWLVGIKECTSRQPYWLRINLHLQRLCKAFTARFVRQEGELININSGVYSLKTSKASQAVSRALVIQLFLKLYSTQGRLPGCSLSEVLHCEERPRMFTFSSFFSWHDSCRG